MITMFTKLGYSVTSTGNNCNIDTYTTIKIICINDNEKLLPLIRKIKNDHKLLWESGARR